MYPGALSIGPLAQGVWHQIPLGVTQRGDEDVLVAKLTKGVHDETLMQARRDLSFDDDTE